MKDKNLKAQRGWSTIMKWQGSYRVGRKVQNLPRSARYSYVLTANLRTPPQKNCLLFSKIYSNITKC